MADLAELDPVLLDAYANEKRLMPYAHLSLQAGDDLILKRMKRRHSRAQAIDWTTYAFDNQRTGYNPAETESMQSRGVVMRSG